ncbi:MAG: hypothetical protein JSW61_14745 [Candidatus Thorarchaeota archaeon]|nr:MAG: hypothetical protein JSW61_14745 [Candidatus Thorarchaeota archaeon]
MTTEWVDQVPADVITYGDNGESPFDGLKSRSKVGKARQQSKRDLNEHL